MLTWRSLEKVGVYSPLKALCCLLPQLFPAYVVEPATEHLLLERVHGDANSAWLSDQSFICMEMPLGNWPQLLAVLFKGISRVLLVG